MNDQIIAFRLQQLETRTDKIDAAIESVAASLNTLAAIKAEMQSANAQFGAALQRLDRQGAKIDSMAEEMATQRVQIDHNLWFMRLLTGAVITGFIVGLWALLTHK